MAKITPLGLTGEDLDDIIELEINQMEDYSFNGPTFQLDYQSMVLLIEKIIGESFILISKDDIAKFDIHDFALCFLEELKQSDEITYIDISGNTSIH